MYEYDVFISYQRDSPTMAPWVHTHFHPRLMELLDDNVDHEVKVFLDKDLPGGSHWPDRIRSALLKTRVLVPVCSPKYFLNEWCLAEWHSMSSREELIGRRTLIYPVIFSDSHNFPDYAHARRMRDLRVYNQPYAHFQDSQAYLDFHREVERIAVELVALIDQAPEWNANWPVETPVPEPPRRPRLPRFP